MAGHNSTDPTIKCPKCKTTIKLTESLAAPLLEATRTEYEHKLDVQRQELQEREAALSVQRAQLSKDKRRHQDQIADGIAAERQKITAEERTRATKLAAVDLQTRDREITALNEVIADRDRKIGQVQQERAELLREKRKLEDDRRELDATVEERVNASLQTIRSHARDEAERDLKLTIADRDQRIESMKRTIEHLKRKSEQGSQQIQGEAQELELEALLRAKFPGDRIEAVPKGVAGGDVIQYVHGLSGKCCGTILWESKRTRNWSDGWLAKLRSDQRQVKADVAILVSQAIPKGLENFELIDGIWVTEFRCTMAVAFAIRQLLIETANARLSKEGRQTKMQVVYAYLTGPCFRQHIAAVVEQAVEMQSELDHERRAMTRLWAKREAQIDSMIGSVAQLFGDLQGIVGGSLREIEGLALPMIEGPREEMDVAA